MLRPVWFGNGDAGREVDIKANELDHRVAFVLLIEYVPPVRGTYKIRVRVRPRDEKIVALIDKHHLRQAPVYVDKAREDADERQHDLSEEMKAGLDAESLGYIWSPHRWMWTATKKLATFVEQQRTLKIDFGTLLDGKEIAGGMDELRRLIFAITETVDRVNAQIAAGQSFDTGEVKIFAPGDKSKPMKPKPQKPNTAPSAWE